MLFRSILQIRRPPMISSLLIVLGPISTKYASSADAPASIPPLQRLSKKFAIVICTRCQSATSFGSNTTQLVFALMLSSTKMNRRRTLTYLKLLLLLAVRAPQIRMPCPGIARIRLMPAGFKISCSAFV